MTDYNAGSYANNNSTVYYGSGVIYTDNNSGYFWVNHAEVPAQENDRKENDMIQRQTFLDALADEGKTITVEEREIIRCADDFKFALLVARLLARVFKSADLAMLKEKPKEVLITKEA